MPPAITIVREGYRYVRADHAWPKLSLLPHFDPAKFPQVIKAARKFGEDTVYHWIGTLASWYEGYYNLKTVATKLQQWRALTAFLVPPPELPPLLFRGLEIAADKLPAPGTPATLGPEGVAFAGHPGLPVAYPWLSWSESRRVALRFCKGGDAALVRSDPTPGAHGILLQLPQGGAAKQTALLWPGLQQHPELKLILRQAYKVQREWALWIVKRVPIMWEPC
jgi:hypothetical protein